MIQTPSLQPESFSFLHVQEYLLKLIEASELEARRIYGLIQDKIKEQENEIRKEIEQCSLEWLRRDYITEDGSLKSGLGAWGWKWTKKDDLIIPDSYDEVTNLHQGRYQQEALLSWKNNKMIQIKWKSYPFKNYTCHVHSFGTFGKNTYRVSLWGKYDSKCAFVIENDKFYPELTQEGFWTIYDQATNQNKVLLLKDWLPYV